MSRIISNQLLHPSHLFDTYNSGLTFLKAKHWGKGQDFNNEGFSKTIRFIQDHFQTRNFNCAAAESPGVLAHRSKFQDKCLFFYFLSAGIFFCLQLMTKSFVFLFHKCRISSEFCRQLTGSWLKNQTFQAPVRAPCLKFWSPEGRSQTPLATGHPLGSSLVLNVSHLSFLLQNGTIDLEEFIGGIALCLHGTVKDKCRLLFHIFNLVRKFKTHTMQC